MVVSFPLGRGAGRSRFFLFRFLNHAIQAVLECCIMIPVADYQGPVQSPGYCWVADVDAVNTQELLDDVDRCSTGESKAGCESAACP